MDFWGSTPLLGGEVSTGNRATFHSTVPIAVGFELKLGGERSGVAQVTGRFSTVVSSKKGGREIDSRIRKLTSGPRKHKSAREDFSSVKA